MNFGNNFLVAIDGGAFSGSFSGSIASNALTIQKANPIYVNQVGDEMTGNLDMKGNKIMNVNDPSDNSHVVNKGYLDHTLRMTLTSIDTTIEQKLQEESEKKIDKNRSPDTFKTFSMNGNKITNVGNPTDLKDVVTKKIQIIE